MKQSISLIFLVIVVIIGFGSIYTLNESPTLNAGVVPVSV